jgi:hypothetical protein
VTTQAECDSRSDCHSVFVDSNNCSCDPVGCCTHFSRCADGGHANCSGPALCNMGAFFCEGPYILSYSGNCYEGCVLQSECAGANAGTGAVLSCVDWYRYPIPNTNNVFINNVWNEQHAGTYPYRQCLTERNLGGGQQYGWSWDWPACDTSTSFAAPEVLFGRKAWDGGASTTPNLPKRIGAIQSLVVDFGVDVVADACYNLNTTMWLTQSDAAPTDPDPQDVTTEVMVRFNDAGNIGGCCALDGNVTLGGIAFEVWHQDAHADASGTTTYTWKMVIYENRTPITDTQFDLALVLQDMVSRGLVQSTNAVQGVELITEVSGGSGQLWLNRFNVTVQ